jgi:hypothetical protein
MHRGQEVSPGQWILESTLAFLRVFWTYSLRQIYLSGQCHENETTEFGNQHVLFENEDMGDLTEKMN